MENIQKIETQEQKRVPVVYFDLVTKLKQAQNDIQEEVKELKELKELKEVKEVKKSNNFIKSKPQIENNFKPRLSAEEYKKRLENCQNVFINELKIYLSEEIKTREEQKTKSKKHKITNLEQIQNGYTNINIIKIINSRIEDSKLEYLENLIRNRQMNFFAFLEEFMNKYNVKTTYKSPRVILLHSPYMMV